ncbi:hypothetical protein F5Y17DRAFT_423319 [Xylariaceae sp. FL0594]|nr:hypothetical protein F5Y17DRAFT_423319 [Xylariaceae sp. FL0594]
MHFIESVLFGLAFGTTALAGPLQVSGTSIATTPVTRVVDKPCLPSTIKCENDWVQECGDDRKWFNLIACPGCPKMPGMQIPSCVRGEPDDGEREVTQSAPSLPSNRSLRHSEVDAVVNHTVQSQWDEGCTHGDRACHHSLESVLFCNHDEDWVHYTDCNPGTFCHRLFMICVPEFIPPIGSTDRPTINVKPAEDADECQEGDRRCSEFFNRVDRCNEDHEWVTYHDCRKSEVCHDDVLECWPLGPDDINPPPYNMTDSA